MNLQFSNSFLIGDLVYLKISCKKCQEKFVLILKRGLAELPKRCAISVHDRLINLFVRKLQELKIICFETNQSKTKTLIFPCIIMVCKKRDFILGYKFVAKLVSLIIQNPLIVRLAIFF